MGPRVLVVDDDPWILRMVTASLEKRKYVVDTAKDGRQALQRAEANPPDAIITDIMMPVMDGWTFVHHLRQHPRLAGVPVIFLTALGKEEARLAQMGLKPEDYLPKPFRFDDLEKRVARALSGGAPPAATIGEGETPLPDVLTPTETPPPVPRQGQQPPPYPPGQPGPPQGQPMGGYPPYPMYGYPGQNYGYPPQGYPQPGQGYPPGYGQFPPQGYPQQGYPYPPPNVPQPPPAPPQAPAEAPAEAPRTKGTGETTRATGKHRRTTALNGRLEQLQLSSLLVMMEMERKDGVLALKEKGGDIGRIYLRGGQVIHAKLESKPDEGGKECVYEMLAWQKGSFSFNATQVDIEDTIRSSTTHLLMEGARLMDEAGRDGI